MKGFLNEPFVDRICGFSANSAIKLDLDLKRQLVEIFFESNKSLIKTKKSSKKISDKLENQFAMWQYIPELKSLSFLSEGYLKTQVYTDPSPTILDELIAKIESEIMALNRNKEMFDRVFENFLTRLQYVLSTNGDTIENITT